MLRKFLKIFMSINTVLCFNISLKKDDIISCAIGVANNNFNFRKPTVVLHSGVDDQLVTDFLIAYKGAVTINTIENGPAKQVVIIAENYQHFIKLLGRVKIDVRGRSLFHGEAKFLVVLNANRKKIENINEFLWSYDVIDVVIITKDKKDRIALYTYFPYKSHLNCQNTEPVLISYWQEEMTYVKMYPDKMRNMHECPLYISTNKIYSQGVERKIPLHAIQKQIVRLLRDIMNFTPIVSAKDYVSIDSDRAKNWSDSLNDVIMGFANISTCTIPLGVDRLGLLDYSMPYFRIRIAWLAPPVAPGPVWWRLLSPLNGYLWLILLVVTFLVISLPYILKLHRIKKFCRKYFKNFDKVHGAAFRVWGAMLGQTIRVAPRRFRDFYIVGLWLWFTFVVRSAYQSVLIGALKTDTITGNFANLKETVDNGYKFGGRAGIYAHFEFDPLIRDGFEIIPEAKFEDLFRDVIESKKKFVLAASLEYAYMYCLAQGKKENECGHVLPDSILTVPLVVWMKMHSPFSRPLNNWLPRMIESGLLEKDAIGKTSYVSMVTSSTDPTALTWHQMVSCFLCLSFGSAISITVFLLEILRKKSSRYTIVKKSLVDGLERDREFFTYKE
ncbi:uncharacterized protein LOC113505401 [Trichoplusia ni]|uniref:Uncharacterized protein LOC113505401 n=1 Tax=Trichoplusia ni TaxID=7111 RepID=A0A7E5WUP2_TRINI|nr:uncharacterized protein LOC113505401 [Trichoplusia ni]